MLKSGCLWDFPGGPVVKNSPCNTGDVGSVPDWGTTIPPAMEQLNPDHTWRDHVPQLRPDTAK